MSFFRPEARAALWRWREVLAAAGLCALGLYWILVPGQLLGWLGWALVAVGSALGFIGYQRGRFRGPGAGPGVVQVDEGQIAYFGPLTGGVVSLASMEQLALDPSGRPSHWVLTQPGQPPLMIPVNAEGADSLFDAFNALPGFGVERMLSALEKPAAHPVVIWERSQTRPDRVWLH